MTLSEDTVDRAVWQNKMSYYNYLASHTQQIEILCDDEYLHSAVTRTHHMPTNAIGNTTQTTSTKKEDTRNGHLYAFYNFSHVVPHDDKDAQHVDTIIQQLNHRLTTVDNELERSKLSMVCALIDDKNAEQKMNVLKDHGYIHLEQSPGMKCHLPSSESLTKYIANPDLPEDFRMFEINGSDSVYTMNDELITRWTHVMVAAFGIPNKNRNTSNYFYHVFRNVPVGPKEPLRLFCGVVGDTSDLNNIVCVGALFIDSDGVPGVYNIATLKNHCGRGYGKLITLEIMKVALEQNYDWMILQASPKGYPIYKKIGFVDTGKMQLLLKVSAVNGYMALASWFFTNAVSRRLLHGSGMMKKAGWVSKNRKPIAILLFIMQILVLVVLWKLFRRFVW